MESRFCLSLLLEPNSLLVLQDDMYKKYLHGIDQRTEDIVSEKICNLSHLGTPVIHGNVLKRTTRVSLTPLVKYFASPTQNLRLIRAVEQ